MEREGRGEGRIIGSMGRMAAWRHRGVGTWMLVLAAVAAVYALGIGWGGGFDVQVGALRLRSRDTARPAMLSGLAFILFLVIDHRRARRSFGLAWTASESAVASRALLAVALIWTITAAVVFSTRAAGGADSYGYVSQVPLLRQGLLVDRVEFDPAFTWRDAPRALVPLGYVPTDAADIIAPLYPPGLPLLMLPASLIRSSAIYLVVPVFGAVLIACTWWAGIRLGDPLAAGLTALFLSASPTFLIQLLQPMSDVPAAACWLAALLLVRRGRAGDVAAGVCVGVAILVRPNLAPLALVVVVTGWRLAPWSLKGVAAFTAPAAAAVFVLLYVQLVRFGSPTATGYGPFQDLFRLEFVAANLRQYPVWVTSAHTPFIWLAALAPLVLRRTAYPTFGRGLLGLAIGVWLLYIPYVAFEPHEWHYTRFLLPALAVMLLMATVVSLQALRLLTPDARMVIATALSAALLFLMGHHAIERRAFHLHDEERKYPAAGEAVLSRVGPGGWVLAVQHSGSLRLYAGSRIVRWDLVEPGDIDRVIDILAARGGAPLLVADPAEVAVFRERFSGSRAVAAMRLLELVQETRIYQFE